MLFKTKMKPISIDPEIEGMLEEAGNVPWVSEQDRSYFKLRSIEFMHLVRTDIFNVMKDTTVLEIGCGNGFIASLMSKYCRKVIGIDLPYEDRRSHSNGLERAREMVGSLGAGNVEIDGGSAEDIPCADNSVDIVFSQYVFDHIPDLNAALKEIDRILKDDGVVVTIVPNFLNRINWAGNYIFSPAMIKNYIRPFYNYIVKKRSWPESCSEFCWGIPPHDKRFTYFDECRRYITSNWKKMFSKNGYEILDMIHIRNDAVMFIASKDKKTRIS